MAHDVFISYSSKDKTIANAACATLEKHEIRCWIAPRDVPPGLQYAAALINAINDCKVFVLILSKGSNASGQVLREVEEAVDNGTPIIPLRIEDFEPTDAMRYYIKSLHWLDAMTPPLERHLGKLAASVQALLSIGAEEQPPPVVETVPIMEAPAKKRWPLPTWATALLALAVVVIMGGGAWFVATQSSLKTVDSEGTSATAEATSYLIPTPSGLATAGSEGTSATEEAAFDLGGQEIRIAVENAYPPFNYIDADTNEAVGWDYDASRAICEVINCVPVFVLAAWEYIFEETAGGEYDMVADGLTITAERDEIVDFSIPYMVITQYILVRSVETEIVDQDSLVASDTLVGTRIGTTNEAKAIELVGEDRVLSYDTFNLPVQALIAGDVRAVVIDEDAGKAFVRQNPGKIMLLPEPITVAEELGFVFPPGSELVEAVNYAIEVLRDDGTLDVLYQKYWCEVETTPSPGWSDWRPLSFLLPNPHMWEESGDNCYTAVGQHDNDAFAWSTESFEGDLMVSLDLESPMIRSEGCVIIYGDGHEHSYGSLIFCVESEFYQLEKHTRYHEGENYLTYSQSNIDFRDKVYSVTIEIIDDVASMYVNEEKVLSTFFDTAEIDRSGRIGLHKQWVGSEITFSNVQVNTSANVDSVSTAPAAEEWECDVDSSGSQPDFYSVKSQFNSHPVQVDGEISSPEEWVVATCVDLRMHYSINVNNPNFQRIRWWVQNNEQDISFLVRIPGELATRGVFLDYFWPLYTGTWAHSDGVYVNIDGEIFDHGKWDELQWHDDEELDPPGTIDVQAAFNNDGEFYWFEIRRPLDSGDSYDWNFEPGQRIGNNPYDSFLIGIVLEEGEFMRYLQLVLGES